MNYFVGVDVGKSYLDIQLGNNYFRIENSETGMTTLQKKLRGLDIKAIVCEASGGYEKTLVNAMRIKGYSVHVAHANKVRAFAKAKGYFAKTDKIDAKVISEYAQLMDIQDDSILLSEDAEQIKALIKRREQLQQDKQRERNRLDKITKKAIKGSIESHLRWLDKELKDIDSALDEATKKDAVKQHYELMTSIPGVGKLVACYLLAYLPELGVVDNKVIAALVGVAPYNHDSGQHQGKRYIAGGRKAIRNKLYMAALVATRFNQDLKNFYTRLRDKGKPVKLALTAVMRKLLTQLNSVVRRQTMWVDCLNN